MPKNNDSQPMQKTAQINAKGQYASRKFDTRPLVTRKKYTSESEVLEDIQSGKSAPYEYYIKSKFMGYARLLVWQYKLQHKTADEILMEAYARLTEMIAEGKIRNLAPQFKRVCKNKAKSQLSKETRKLKLTAEEAKSLTGTGKGSLRIRREIHETAERSMEDFMHAYTSVPGYESASEEIEAELAIAYMVMSLSRRDQLLLMINRYHKLRQDKLAPMMGYGSSDSLKTQLQKLMSSKEEMLQRIRLGREVIESAMLSSEEAVGLLDMFNHGLHNLESLTSEFVELSKSRCAKPKGLPTMAGFKARIQEHYRASVAFEYSVSQEKNMYLGNIDKTHGAQCNQGGGNCPLPGDSFLAAA